MFAHLGLLAMLASEESGAGGPFAINPGLMIWTWVIFLVFLYFFSKTFWPTIVAQAEEREKTIAAQLAAAEKSNNDAKALLAEQQKATAEARAAAQTMLAEAKVAAERERAAGAERAKREHEEMMERTRREIGAERDKAVADLRREAVELALGAAAKVLGQRLDSDADRRLVVDYLSKVETTH